MAATLIGDGVAMDLQFIKNRRLIVRDRGLHPKLPWRPRICYAGNTNLTVFKMKHAIDIYVSME